MSGLTQADVTLLRQLLGTTPDDTNADRGGFYLAYYDMLMAHGQTDAARQVLLQAHISTYSGVFGGAALVGNAIAKAANLDKYDVSLKHFSWNIADTLLRDIENRYALSQSTLLTAEEIRVSDRSVWDSKDIGEYFPGNFQLWDQDINFLLSAGTVSSALAGYQLMTGGNVGYQASDFAFSVDTSHSDYDVIRDANGKVVYVEAKIELIQGFDQSAFEGNWQEKSVAALDAVFSVTQAAGPAATALTATVTASAIISNGAFSKAAATMASDFMSWVFTDVGTDFGLRSTIDAYVGANSDLSTIRDQLPAGFAWEEFPIILKTTGDFFDGNEDSVLLGYGNAAMHGGGGEDFALGFGTAQIFGDGGNDLLVGKEESVLRGYSGGDTLVSTDSSKAYGGVGKDWMFAALNSEAHGEADDDTIVGIDDARIYGGAGKDWIVTLDRAVGEGGDGDDWHFAFGSSTTYGQGGDDVFIAFDQSTVYGDAGSDWIFQNGNGEVFGGADRDYYIGLGGGKVDLGEGDDVVIYAGPGTLITTGSGQDSILFSRGAGISDADGFDQVAFYGGNLLATAATRPSESESPMAVGIAGLYKIGFNVVGEMVIGDVFSRRGVAEDFMYLMNAVTDPLAPLHALTAGIRVVELEFDSMRLRELPNGLATVLDWNEDFWTYIVTRAKDVSGLTTIGGADPLVLDLDGDGIELTPRLSPGIGPKFDVDGDGFAEPTGWVAADDGLLAVDLNGNGTIDDVTELFGDATTSGFDALAAYDTNGDGVVDASDTGFGDLRVWRDLDGDAVTDAGELSTLADLGIQSIGVTGQADGSTIALNTVERTGTFTFTGGATGTVGDIRFLVNDFHTTWQGDSTVDPVLTAGMPNLKGYGTLTDLHVALTLEGAGGALATTITSVMPTLDVVDLAELRARSLPVLQAWADAVPIATAPNNRDVPLMVRRDGNGTEVLDFAVLVTEMVDDGQGGQVEATFFRLVSGGTVDDANGDPILTPDMADVLAQSTTDPTVTWELLTGAELDYIERYLGADIPLDDLAGLDTGSIGGLSDMLTLAHHMMDLQALRLAVQGPLAPYFAGIEYVPEDDVFRATTDRQLTPMLEAVLTAAPADAPGATAWLEDWNPIVNALLADYDRGGEHLQITHPFMFTHLVAAFENVGLPIDLQSAAIALGLPQDRLDFGSGVRVGTSGFDMFYMSAGDDTVQGGAGADVYVFGRDFGSDRIEEYEHPGHSYDTIRFAHLTPNDVTMHREGKDLIITETGTANTIRVVNNFYDLSPNLFGGFDNPDEGIEEIVFADGTVWTAIEIAQALPKPAPTDDIIEGTDHVDFLDGGAGNDILRGGNNMDFYAFDVGYGTDRIEEFADHALITQTDMVTFGPGVTVDNVRFSRTGNSDDFVISIDGTTDTLTIDKQFHVVYPGVLESQWFHRIEAFRFDDGTVLTWEDAFDTVLRNARTDGDDTIYGVAKADTLDGGAGNDYLSGGDESDTYVFGRGYGQDTVEEGLVHIYSDTNDRVLFNPDVAVGDVTFQRGAQEHDLKITIAGTTDELTIIDQFYYWESGVYGVISLDRVETFEFADGTVFDWSDVHQTIVANLKTDGDDVIQGFWYGDVIDGGAGNDLLNGSDGEDTYIFGYGYGSDTIHEQRDSAISGDTDKVSFLAGVTAQNITFERVAGTPQDLVIKLDGTTDELKIVDNFRTGTVAVSMPYVEEYHFTDGTVLTRQDVKDRMLSEASTAGDDTVMGFEGADTLDGGAGTDLLIGWEGDDTYVFDVGHGHDTIDDQGEFASNNTADTVTFGAGIAPGDVTLQRSGKDLVIVHSNGVDRLTVKNQFDLSVLGGFKNAIESFVFTDGTVWTDADIRTMLTASTTGDDTIVGFDSDDVLDGGLGNDRLEGTGGADTYVFGRGYGVDTIYENPPPSLSGSGDRVDFKADIAPADLTGAQNGDDLVLSVSGTSDQLIVEGYFAHADQEVEYFYFTNGTVWQRQDIDDLIAGSAVTFPEVTHAGTDGNDTVTGSSGDDVLSGGLGDDTLKGSAGNDTYLYSVGDGDDRIIEQGFNNDIDQIIFGAGLLASDLVLVRGTSDVDDVTLTFTGVTGSVKLEEQFYLETGAKRVERIVFADGTTWNEENLKAAYLAQVTTDGDDEILGFFSDDVLAGGLGNDTLEGGYGSDDYHYAVGDGDDVIFDKGGSASVDTDRLVLGAGLEVADAVLTRSTTDDDDVTLTFNGVSGSIKLDEQFWSTSGSRQIEEIVFNDGTIWDRAAILDKAWFRGTAGNDTITATSDADKIDGGAGNDTLNGAAGDDLIVGGDGADTMTGGTGNDTFAFAAGFGDDVITDFTAGAASDDVIELQGLGVSTFAAVQALMSEVAGDTVIDIDASNSITLTGVAMASLHEDDFRYA